MIKNEIILNTVQQLLQKDKLCNDDILSVTELDLSKKGLLEISDLKHFVNLRKLNLQENRLSDLSPLANLVNLRNLVAGNDPFLSEEEKAARKGKNHYTDYSFLSNLSYLEYVDFTDTDISDISFVSHMPWILEFSAYSNPISDISPLSACPKLQKAYFYDCLIDDISVARELPDLTGLALNECKHFSDLSPIASRTAFKYLDIHGTSVSSISHLCDMEDMLYLTLAGTKVSDITPLQKMQQLKWLTLEVANILSFEHILSVLPTLSGLDIVALHNWQYSDEQASLLQQAMPSVKLRFNEFGVW